MSNPATDIDRLTVDNADPQPLLVVGSVAFDSIQTPFGTGERILGGSASYAALAASYYTDTQLVGVVGNDFEETFVERYRRRGIDLEGLQRDESGPTFFWKGKYLDDFQGRETLEIELNVFEKFQPHLPEAYRKSPYVMLGNIHPALLLHVFDQLEGKPFTITDTIDLWIHTTRDDLLKVMKKVDMFVLNDEEVALITEKDNLIEAGWKLLEMGPKMAIVKKGAHGAYLFHKEGLFALPAFPVTDLRDPTGAGDSFAGAFLGYLAAVNKTDYATIKRAMIYATATASLTVEAFSCDRLESAGAKAVQERADEIIKMISL